jgi:hypothetical protein
MPRAIVVCLVVIIFSGCQTRNSTPLLVNNTLFEVGEIQGVVDGDLKEASGISESVANPGLLWVHNDGGDKSRIFLIDKEANRKGVVKLDKITHRDWEDMAVGPGPQDGKNYIYIGDIGDNDAKHKYKYIYRIEEPVMDLRLSADTTITEVDCIKFQLPDGSRDSEAIMVDPLTKDLYIISKREQKVNLYRLPFPQSTTQTMTAELVSPKLEFNQYEAKSVSKDGNETLINGYHSAYYNQIVGCDISHDGQELLIKSYSSVYYWKREGTETVSDILKRTPTLLPYVPEPQGEAITFDLEGKGYYTLSEERGKFPQRLFFYRRK